MWKKLSRGLLVFISLIWLVFTFFQLIPGMDSVGELFTYSTSIFSSKNYEPRGEITLESNDVSGLEIHIDSLGIPHIFGANSNEVCFGVGYMHASDRYFQMEALTRYVQGNMSEMIGTLGLQKDAEWVAYEFDEKAQKVFDDLEVSDPKVHSELIYYAKGVNFYLDQQSSNEIPPEYKLFNATPREWKPYYSILLSWYMSDVLTNYNLHGDREEALNRLDADLFQLLFNRDTTNYPYSIPGTFGCDALGLSLPDKSLDLPIETVAESALERETRLSIGSNHWAVGGKRSKSGKALLSNDTHLNLSLPSSWYEVHLVCPEYETYGLSLPASPYVVSGTNEYLSWGITNAQWDLSEKYILEVNPKDTTQYRIDGKWVKFKEKTFTIPLQNGQETTVTHRFTSFGRVTKEGKNWVVNWWYPNEDNASIRTFHDLALAKDWTDFKNALSDYTYPAQNFAYADVEGNVGMISAGKLPLRSTQYHGGVVYLDKFPNHKFVPFDCLPMQFTGKDGFVYSANQPPANTTYYINNDWPERYRAERISGLLTAKDSYDLQDMLRVQGDIRDMSVSDLHKVIKKYETEDELWNLIDPLKSWDGTIDHESYEAVLHFYFTFLLKQEINTLLQKNCRAGMQIPLDNMYAMMLKKETVDFCGKTVKFSELLKKVLKMTQRQFIKDYGKGFEKKATYTHHGVMTIEHFLQLPGFGEWMYNAGGNGQTVNINVNRTHGASMRTNFEMTNRPKGYIIIAGGQSGKPNDSNYKDQLMAWKKVQYHAIQFVAEPKALKGIVARILIQ